MLHIWRFMYDVCPAVVVLVVRALREGAIVKHTGGGRQGNVHLLVGGKTRHGETTRMVQPASKYSTSSNTELQVVSTQQQHLFTAVNCVSVCACSSSSIELFCIASG